MRCGGTPHWKEPEVTTALSDRLAALRSAGRVGGVAGNWRMRIDQGRNVTRKLRRLASCGGLALACRRRHRSPQSERTDPGPFRYGRAGSDGRGWGGAAMMIAGRPAKLLLIDSNVYFSKRLSDALKREGFEVTSSTQPAFALTTLEYDAPSAIVCSTNMREMGALDIARMIRADVKNSAMPIIALGDGGQRALMEAFQAGCDDYIDRTRPPAVMATHVKNIIISKAEGFQPTQMLAQSDTSLSGSLTHHDLPGVMQMLGHAHQTGALHINSGETDALLFFDAGTITHAECGSLFGDEAVIHVLKNCFQNSSGVYKFVYGSASAQRTVLRSATDLMLDAMREVDESSRDLAD